MKGREMRGEDERRKEMKSLHISSPEQSLSSLSLSLPDSTHVSTTARAYLASVVGMRGRQRLMMRLAVARPETDRQTGRQVSRQACSRRATG